MGNGSRNCSCLAQKREERGGFGGFEQREPRAQGHRPSGAGRSHSNEHSELQAGRRRGGAELLVPGKVRRGMAGERARKGHVRDGLSVHGILLSLREEGNSDTVNLEDTMLSETGQPRKNKRRAMSLT